MRDRLVVLAAETSVDVNRVAVRFPEESERVVDGLVQVKRQLTVVSRLFVVGSRNVEAPVVRTVSVVVVAGDDDLAGVERLHDVLLDARETRIEARALHLGLHPERAPPPRLLLQPATALVIAVAMRELRLHALAQIPEALRVLEIRDVPHEFARLQLRRDELSVRKLLHLQLHDAVLHLDTAVLRLREPVRVPSPEVRAIAPLRLVERRAVEFVVPDELERLAHRQERRRAIGDSRGFFAGNGIGVERHVSPCCEAQAGCDQDCRHFAFTTLRVSARSGARSTPCFLALK